MMEAVVFVLAQAAGTGQLTGSALPPSPSTGGLYGHAYYLFLMDNPDGAEACYVPLLVTSQPLEDLARGKSGESTVVISTYERDSIVGVERGVSVSARDVEPRERKLRLRERRYRYQQVGAPEALRLLEHPEGTIPIHRTPPMAPPSRSQLEDLIARFRTAR